MFADFSPILSSEFDFAKRHKSFGKKNILSSGVGKKRIALSLSRDSPSRKVTVTLSHALSQKSANRCFLDSPMRM